MKAIDLISKVDIPFISNKNGTGFHGDYIKTKLDISNNRSMTNYVSRDGGLFPTSIIVNIRHPKVEYKEEQNFEGFSIGEINIRDHRLTLVDGKHRLEALDILIRRFAAYEEFPFIVTFLINQSPFNEMTTYHNVQNNASRPRTEVLDWIHYRMLWEKGHEYILDKESSNALVRAYSMEFLQSICSNYESVFFNQIRPVVNGQEYDFLVSQSYFIKRIKPIITDKRFSNMAIETIASYFDVFWNDLADRVPAALSYPNSLLFMDPAFPVFVKVFIEILAKSMLNKYDFNLECEDYLDNLINFDEEEKENSMKITENFFIPWIKAGEEKTNARDYSIKSLVNFFNSIVENQRTIVVETL
ncbi:hypothetical protein KQH27_00900 [bacterium]|nr:hypothetical protein [bacterium]